MKFSTTSENYLYREGSVFFSILKGKVFGKAPFKLFYIILYKKKLYTKILIRLFDFEMYTKIEILINNFEKEYCK